MHVSPYAELFRLNTDKLRAGGFVILVSGGTAPEDSDPKRLFSGNEIETDSFSSIFGKNDSPRQAPRDP